MRSFTIEHIDFHQVLFSFKTRITSNFDIRRTLTSGRSKNPYSCVECFRTVSLFPIIYVLNNYNFKGDNETRLSYMDTDILNMCDSLDYFLIASLIFNVIKKKNYLFKKLFF